MNPLQPEAQDTWYIVKLPNQQCKLVSHAEFAHDFLPSDDQSQTNDSAPEPVEFWGPYPTQQEAIARRVGLIRAGKCKPT
jgi:hypothetical protein